MDKTVVVFTKNNARVLKNPPNAEKYYNMENAIVNPDLSKVKGIPTHLWEKNGNGIIPIYGLKREARLHDIEKNGIDNKIESIAEKQTRPKRFKLLMKQQNILLFFQILSCALMAYLIIKKGI